MTLVIPDSGNWGKKDYRNFIEDYYKYILNLDSSKLSPKQKRLCGSILKDLADISMILFKSRLTRKTKRQLDNIIYWVVLKSIEVCMPD